MQSSYNLIKKDRALSGDLKKISTEYNKVESYESIDEVVEESGITLEEAQNYIKNYENIGRNILAEAQAKRDSFMVEAITKAEAMEKEAYEKGYEQGVENGYSDGKKEALDKYIPQAENQYNNILMKAEKILKGAEKNYEEYLESKKQEIIKLSISIAEKILAREINKESGINELVDEALKLSKGEENVIIKCNPIHENELKKQINMWKTSYNISGEIFILSSENIAAGNAIIEKSSGMIKVGIDVGLEKVKEAILG
ncbi:FliH/SctL family protein [Clostridium paraputrificum]|uniref:FliH/SctL family protein n=1 Tax=Clostridium TaxID=1485 RepID=UPI003D34E011